MHKNINKIISSVLIGSFAMSNAAVLAIGSDNNTYTNEDYWKSTEETNYIETNAIEDISSLELVKNPDFTDEELEVSENTYLNLYSYVAYYNSETQEYTDLSSETVILELKLENPRMGYVDEDFNFIPTKIGEIKGTVKIKGLDQDKASVPITLNSTVTEENGSIEVKYVDATSKKSIAETIYINTLKEGESIDVESAEIKDYKLNGESTVSVSIEKDNLDKTVTFEYSKIIEDVVEENTTGSVTVKYVDKSTGKEIATSIKEDNKELGEYKYKAKEIKGYTLIGENEKSVTLSKENASVEIVFEYNKEITGTLTINYIDEETGNKIADSVVMTDLPLGEVEYEPLDIKGYMLLEPLTIKANITEANLNQTADCIYAKIYKTEFSFSKEELKEFAGYKQGASFFGNTFVLRMNQDILEKVIASSLDKVSFKVLEEPSNREEVFKLFEDNKLEVLDSFSIETNLKEVPDNMILELIRQQLDTFEIGNFYLYRVDSKAKSLTLDYVGEGTLVENEAIFKVASKSLDGSTFVITSNKRSVDKEGSINKPVSDSEKVESGNKNELPDTSGISLVIKGLSVLGIVGSIFLIKKKK